MKKPHKTMTQLRHERRCAALLRYLDTTRRAFERDGKRDTGVHVENGRNAVHLASLVASRHVEVVKYGERRAHRITAEGIAALEAT